MRGVLPLLLAALLLQACAFLPSTPSWVEEVSEADAAMLAPVITDLLREQWAPGSTTLLLEVPRQANNPLTPALQGALRKAGYALADPELEELEAHHLRYLVSPLGEGVLVRLAIDRMEASRWYRRDPTGHLVAASPWTVRQKQGTPSP